jgi:hypothetical protein
MRAILAALLCALAAAASAAPYAVRLGAERVVLDAPPGFSDTTELGSPRLQELAETLTPASNRILLFALTDADVRRFMQGDQIEARRYMIAVTPKGLERERVTAALFAEFVADSLRELGKPAAAADYRKFLDQQPHGKANLLSELRREPAVVSVLQGTRLPQQGGGWTEKPPQYVLSTTTLLLVRGKALRIDVFTGFDNPADMEWLAAITRRWVEELIRLNKR